jgi:hypothetical protein
MAEEKRINKDFQRIKERLNEVLDSKQEEVIRVLYSDYYAAEPKMKKVKALIDEIKFSTQRQGKIFDLLIKQASNKENFIWN